MKSLTIQELLDAGMTVHGAEDFDRRESGLSPRRLPAWTRPQLPQAMDVMARMPSGVRLRFRTSSETVGLTLLTTRFVTPPATPQPVSCNLEIAGELRHASSELGNIITVDRRNPNDFELQRGDPDTFWFRNLPTGSKLCELWLPHNAYVELRSLQIDDDAELTPAPAPEEPRWVHYGSSISHCMEAIEPALVWPAVAARHAGCCLQSFGFGGQCHLDQFMARTIRDSEADLISLKVGINVVNADSMRERVFVPALHGFLDTIRDGKPTTPLMVISPIYCPSAESHPGPTVPNAQGKFVTLPGHDEIRDGCLSLQRVRKLLERVVGQRRSAGDANLHYVDGLELFGVADAGDLPDDLHPNPAGYVRMGERFAPRLAALRDQL